METEMDYQALQRAAAERYRAGDLTAAIDLQIQLVNGLMALRASELERQPKLTELLDETTEQVIDILRWQRQFDKAIALQERLAEFFPKSAGSHRLRVAQLHVEAGDVERGLNQLKTMVEREPENFWFKVSLAASYLWLDRYTDAEPILRHSGEMTHVRKVDRALAYQYLFQMCSRFEERVNDALAAWREAGRLDRSLRVELLPAVCRILIYWRRYEDAKKHIATDHNRVRQLFYLGLVYLESGNAKDASEAWRTILIEYNPHDNMEALDEYTEACVRLLNMTTAVKLLQPLVDSGQLNYLRLVILALAYAQNRDIDKSRWYLDMALRLGDSERVRLTRPAPQGRILDIHARMLYAEIILDPPVRQAIDMYFIPEVS